MKPFFISLLLILLCAATPSYADPSTDYIRVECNKDLNYLLINRLRLDVSVSQKMSKTTKANLFKKYNLIDSSSLIEYDEDENVQIGKTSTTTCKLKDKIYTVTLEGYPENSNPMGMCGGWYSTFIGIKDQKSVLLDDISFDESCNSEKSISQILITPDQDYMIIDGLGTQKTIFNDQYPVKSEQIYKDQ